MTNKFKKSIQRLRQKISKKQVFVGYLGIIYGGNKLLHVLAKPSYYYVRTDFGEVIQAKNISKLSPIFNLQVVIEYDGTEYRIIGTYSRDTVTSSGVEKHWAQHSLLFNQKDYSDVVWVDPRQIVGGSVFPSPKIYGVSTTPFMYIHTNGEVRSVVNTEIDLSSYKPSDGKTPVIIGYNTTTESFIVIQGTNYTNSFWFDNLPVVPDGVIPLATVLLNSDEAQITWEYIIDLRSWVQPHVLGSTNEERANKRSWFLS